MAFRGKNHDKTDRRVAGCGTKSAQRRARKYACRHGARISYEERKRRAGAN